jgi:hypothetical protein
MMPQDEIRSENDLGFMTEVDAEFKNQRNKVSQSSERRLSTRHSEVDGNTSQPRNYSSLLEIE